MSYLMLARICKAVMTPFKLINTVMKGEKGGLSSFLCKF